MTTATALALSTDAQNLLFREAHTASTWSDEPVSEAQIREVYDLVKFGPSSANTQPLRILLVPPGDARERLLPHLSEGNREKTGQAPMVAVLAADIDFHENMERIFPHAPGAREWWPERDSRARAAVFNAGIQIGYFIVGIRAAGLAAGPQSGFDKDGVDAEFFAGSSWRSQVVCNIGYPGEDAFSPRNPRLDVDEVIRTA